MMRTILNSLVHAIRGERQWNAYVAGQIAQPRFDSIWVRFRDLIQIDLQGAEARARAAADNRDTSELRASYREWRGSAVIVLTQLRAEQAVLRRSASRKDRADQFDALMSAYLDAAVMFRDGDTSAGVAHIHRADVLWEDWIRVIEGREGRR